MMRKYLPLRPMLYAQEIAALAARLSAEGNDIDLDGEAERIARRCGMSPAVASKDFQKTFWPSWQRLSASPLYGMAQS